MFVVISDHICDTPGCASVLILDGNMKNARQVCACKNVGLLHFAGLEGSVVIGIYVCISYHYNVNNITQLFHEHALDMYAP